MLDDVGSELFSRTFPALWSMRVETITDFLFTLIAFQCWSKVLMVLNSKTERWLNWLERLGGGGGGGKLLSEWKLIRASAFWGSLARMASVSTLDKHIRLKIQAPRSGPHKCQCRNRSVHMSNFACECYRRRIGNQKNIKKHLSQSSVSSLWKIWPIAAKFVTT